VGLHRQQLTRKNERRKGALLEIRHFAEFRSWPAQRKAQKSTNVQRQDSIMQSDGPAGSIDYRLGTLHAIATALLMSFQAPFSAFAARSLGSLDFMAFTQLALLFSIPLLILQADSPRDFAAIVFGVRHWPKLAVIFLIGVAGLRLYNIGLSSTHPIITAAVLNLTPFWAALIAFLVSKRSMLAPPFAFLPCFLLGFCGAMAIAWSQIDVDSKVLARDVIESFIHSKWIYALPTPAFFALSGTLVYRWFSDFDEPAAIAANFVVSSLVLIPIAALTSDFGQAAPHLSEPSTMAVLLLLVGTLAGSAAGRVFYQMALTATKDDNGYVTMFFLLIPALSALISFVLSRWIPGLRFVPSGMFFVGMALVTASLFLLSAISWRAARAGSRPLGGGVENDEGDFASADARDPRLDGGRLPSASGAL
jgi:drug/metabolite transporter (DMT)-like permease